MNLHKRMAVFQLGDLVMILAKTRLALQKLQLPKYFIFPVVCRHGDNAYENDILPQVVA